MRRRKVVFGILIMIWMAVIFTFSSRTGDESAEDSYDVGYMVGRIVVPAFESQTTEEQLAFAAKVDHPIRKTAHFLEYTLLGILAVGITYDVDRKRLYCILYPWIFATIYAASDEIHQLAVPERSGQLSDVILDSAGALTGVMISILAVYLYQKHKHKV